MPSGSVRTFSAPRAARIASSAASRLPGGRVRSSISRFPLPGPGSAFVHRLELHAREHALGPVLAAVARPLDSAEWRVGAADHVTVDADHAGLEPGREAALAAEVAGPGVGCEAVGQAIGLLDHLGLPLERVDQRYGAERFLVHDLRIERDLAEHRGLVEEPAVANALAAGVQPGAPGGRVAD